jgi:hypothetical protein
MEFFFSVPAGVRIVCFVIVSTALLGQAAPASSLCLGFEGLLVQGEWIRIFSFPFVVASGWLGFPHLMAVLLAFVLVGSSCERRLGSVAFLSNMIWLVLLLWLSVVLFALFAVLMGFLVVSVVPTLPQVIQEVKVPDWKPCPSGWCEQEKKRLVNVLLHLIKVLRNCRVDVDRAVGNLGGRHGPSVSSVCFSW